MTPRHANRGPDGKFVRADGKATLHRQVPEPCAETAAWLAQTAPKSADPIATGAGLIGIGGFIFLLLTFAGVVFAMLLLAGVI